LTWAFFDDIVRQGHEEMSKNKLSQPWTIWITGLSGSGKSTICKELNEILDKSSIVYEYIRADEIRQFLTPNPTFSQQEKELIYRSSILVAELMNNQGINAIIDSVDGRGEGRELGKEVIGNFHVIWIDCPVDICIDREKDREDKAEIFDLYQRALQGELKLPGLGYDYAYDKSPLLKLDSSILSAEESAKLIAEKLI
jgi:adenylylsulfate kinase